MSALKICALGAALGQVISVSARRGRVLRSHRSQIGTKGAWPSIGVTTAEIAGAADQEMGKQKRSSEFSPPNAPRACLWHALFMHHRIKHRPVCE